jgi:hypothetical protein
MGERPGLEIVNRERSRKWQVPGRVMPHGPGSLLRQHVSCRIHLAANDLPIESRHLGIAPRGSKSGRVWQFPGAVSSICPPVYSEPGPQLRLRGPSPSLLRRVVVRRPKGILRVRPAHADASPLYNALRLAFRLRPKAQRRQVSCEWACRHRRRTAGEHRYKHEVGRVDQGRTRRATHRTIVGCAAFVGLPILPLPRVHLVRSEERGSIRATVPPRGDPLSAKAARF